MSVYYSSTHQSPNHTSTHPPVYSSTYPPHPSIHPFIHPPTHSFIIYPLFCPSLPPSIHYPSIHTSIHLPIHLSSIHSSIHPSIIHPSIHPSMSFHPLLIPQGHIYPSVYLPTLFPTQHAEQCLECCSLILRFGISGITRDILRRTEGGPGGLDFSNLSVLF